MLDSKELKQAFQNIKDLFADGGFLYYQDPDRPLYINMDESKAFSIGAIVYHIKGDPPPTIAELNINIKNSSEDKSEHTKKTLAWLKQAKQFPSTKVQPILFLSKALTQAERKYSPTKLEIAAIV